MKGRTYRYFQGEPLYTFGHGLSYTRFEYSSLRLDRSAVGPRTAIQVSMKVRNVGKRAGDEVVQLYARHAEPKEKVPLKQLRGFERIHLNPGEQRDVTFRLTPAEDFTHYDIASKAYAVAPGPYEIQIGASSADIRLTGRVQVR
jgi:beta-glucosidase